MTNIALPKDIELYTNEYIFDVTRHCIDEWNRGDLDATLATYTGDVIYKDPKIRGRLHGNAELRRYLEKFFRVWTTTFVVTDEQRIVGENAQVCMWDCEMTHRGTGRSCVLSGMDLCVVNGEQLSRDEAFMDTLPLEELKTAL